MLPRVAWSSRCSGSEDRKTRMRTVRAGRADEVLGGLDHLGQQLDGLNLEAESLRGRGRRGTGAEAEEQRAARGWMQ